MKNTTYIIITLAAFLAGGCNKQKAAIEEDKDATNNAIDTRKAEVDAEAKKATELTDANAAADKARIKADKESAQAQLDADKKKVDAEAEAAKARVDAENRQLLQNRDLPPPSRGPPIRTHSVLRGPS